MSSDESNSGQQSRSIAKRVFAEEYNDATHVFKDGDAEKSPRVALLPTGEKANRLFVVGTVTEVENIGSNDDFYRMRLVDPTGRFLVYAGQYQQDAAAEMASLETPCYAAVMGKPKLYNPEDGDPIMQMTPESVSQVRKETRDQWVLETAELTLDRIEATPSEEVASLLESQYEGDAAAYKHPVIEALESLEEEDSQAKATA
jgi:RPA family protein